MKLKLALVSAMLACGSNMAYAGWADGTFGGLSAKIYTPDSKPASGRMLFVNLHGCAQKNTDLQKSNWDGVAEKHNAIVVLPNAANPTLIGCWNYGNPSINQADMNAVIKGTKDFIAASKYGIDSTQVYISGISAGASFAATVACANPDLYAGVGSAAGPTISSDQMKAMSGGTPNVSSVVSYCKNLSAGREGAYKTQLYAQAYGADPAAGDGVAGPGWIEPNHKIQQGLYGLQGAASYKNDIQASLPTAGRTNTNEAEYYVGDALGNKRISLIVIAGMGHAWPGGVPKAGAVGSYVSNKFDFGEWMAVNFTANNCRIPANQGKAICSGKGETTTTTTVAATTSTTAATTSTTAATTSTTKATTSTTKATTSTTAATTSTTKASTTTTQATTTSSTKASTTTTSSTTHTTGMPTTTTTKATTTTTVVAGGACFNTYNLYHVWNGRAYDLFGTAYALGSNQKMGYDNLMTKTKLRQKGLAYYVIDNTCP